ncbi:hypothetical protein EVAR_19569_1 [Eumeta japonica]|uniref:Uncharacterized protein n=1 Tax=Eumeta variegata TaxID=151549 RepID=A0A4C1UFH2_EUMVA|nr:hypothetical protein EVAR_19569_1 [Eumeta japonica]
MKDSIKLSRSQAEGDLRPRHLKYTIFSPHNRRYNKSSVPARAASTAPPALINEANTCPPAALRSHNCAVGGGARRAGDGGISTSRGPRATYWL